MRSFRWSRSKNERLKRERDVSFEAVVVAIEAGHLLDVLEHRNPGKYPGQQVMVVNVDGYAYLVPFVESTDHLFLKTVIPSPKATRHYLRRSEI